MPREVVVNLDEIRRLRAACDETHSALNRAIAGLADAAAALAQLIVALAPLELAARRSALDVEEEKEHE